MMSVKRSNALNVLSNQMHNNYEMNKDFIKILTIFVSVWILQ